MEILKYSTHTFTRVVHWDVNNERLHGIWFEEQTGEADLLDTMFRDVRAHDPNATLFLNDYNVISSSRMTQVGHISTTFALIGDVCTVRGHIQIKRFLTKCAFIVGACSPA